MACRAGGARVRACVCVCVRELMDESISLACAVHCRTADVREVSEVWRAAERETDCMDGICAVCLSGVIYFSYG